MSHKNPFYLCLLRGCLPYSAISQAKQCHAQIQVQGLLPRITRQTHFVLVYARCGILHARQLFDRMFHRNMHLWNIIIASYVDKSLYYDALLIFREFNTSGLRPDHYTLPPLFKASAAVGNICLGWVVRLGYEGYVIVGSSLVEFYVKCGAMDEARWVFSDMPFRNSVVCNVMISGYGRAGFYAQAMNCFSEMLLNGVKIDYVTVPSVLNACGREGDLMKGKQVHGYVVKSFMFDVDAAIGNALINMYGKCGCLQDSEKVFRSMLHANLVTWTTMISCYGIHGKGYESLFLFKIMIHSWFTPNSLTLAAILASCSHSGLIDQGWQFITLFTQTIGLSPMQRTMLLWWISGGSTLSY